MKHIILTVSTLLITGISYAETYELSAQCKETFENQALQSEAKIMAEKNISLPSELKAEVRAYDSYNDKGKIVIHIALDEEIDGYSVNYRALITKEELNNCSATFERNNEWACRYSNYNYHDLEEIPGMKWMDGPDVATVDGLSDIQIKQIRNFLEIDETYSQDSTDELIKQTDDGLLYTAKVTLPNGTALDYFEAYGGDNPFGVFYLENTTEVAGVNSDSDMCIY